MKTNIENANFIIKNMITMKYKGIIFDLDGTIIDTVEDLNDSVNGVLKEKKIFNDSKGYIAYRIKDKKFKDIQIKFSSNKPFGLFSCTLQGFVAGYIKR